MTSRRVPPAWREGDDGCRPYAGSFARALDGGTLAEGPPAAWAAPPLLEKEEPLAPETHWPLYI